jgi:transcription antitermination factor NusG
VRNVSFSSEENKGLFAIHSSEERVCVSSPLRKDYACAQRIKEAPQPGPERMVEVSMRPTIYQGTDVHGCIAAPVSGLPIETKWYAAYTCAKHERSVAEQLALRGVEHFHPRYQVHRRWNRRLVVLDLPLFPGYVFVRIPWSERLRVLEVPGVVYLVTFGGVPAALETGQIELLRTCLASAGKVLPHPFLQSGRRVHFCEGPFRGLAGVLQRSKGRRRLIVSIEVIQKSMSVEVDAATIEPV